MAQMHWTVGIHHDGSALYVSNPTPTLGETVAIQLRAPLNAPIKAIFLRTTPDGENHLERMEIVENDAVSACWSAPLRVSMPVMNYRFKILTRESAYFLNQFGVSRADRPDHYDFKLLADFDGPTWLEDAIFYQIFPDRFHNGDPSLNHVNGEWTRHGKFSVKFKQWGELPKPYAESGSLDFFGGDLPGIQQKFDYLKDLGVNALYLCPIFDSLSNHRYNIKDFFTVDKHLGGNDALVKLSQALHGENMRLILDVTPNHSASAHPWFLDAQDDENAPSGEFYTFHNRPDDYEMWLGVPTLPKLNYSSEKLRDMMYRRHDSVIRFWLNPPYNVDGWRLDVANMTARQGASQLAHEVWREMRQVVKQDKPEAYLFGEDFFDGTPYLQGDELDATMNYQGFNIPTWRWLAGHDLGIERRPETADPTPMPSEAYEEQLRHFRAAIPWIIARQQFNQLGSHDTTRILNVVKGNKALVKLGMALLMTYVGVPCIYYGDEIGLPGGNDPDNRRTMPWDESAWDHDLREWCKRLIHLRKTAPALLRGGYQTLHAQGDVLAYLRASSEQRIVFIGHRGQDAIRELTIPVRHGGIPDGAQLVSLLDDRQSFTVRSGTITLRDVPHGGAYVLDVR